MINRCYTVDCTNAFSGGTEGQLPSELGTRCVVELTLRVYPLGHNDLNTRIQNRALSPRSHSLVLITFS